MPCNSKIFQAIENDCTPVKGIAPIAEWAYRSDVSFSFSDNNITAITKTLPLGLFKSFKFGLNASHELKSFDNFPDRFIHKFSGVATDASLALDTMDDIVVFVQPNGGTAWKVYGAKNGLWKTAQTEMSNDNMGVIAFEFTSREGLEEDYESYNTNIDVASLSDMDSFGIIAGGNTLSGGAIRLFIDSDKTGYIKLPNGNVLTTVAGVIDTINEGIEGAITYYIPRDTNEVSAYESDLLGDVIISGFTALSVLTLNDDALTSIDISNLALLSDLNASGNQLSALNVKGAKLLTVLNVSDNQLSNPRYIGDALYQAYSENIVAINYNFAGGTNALQSEVNTYLQTNHGINYATVYARLVTQNAGTIVIDTI